MKIKKRELGLEVIKYLESKCLEINNHYEWRYVSGLIGSLRESYNVTDEEHDNILKDIKNEILTKEAIRLYAHNIQND
jgi:phosphorylcholine metabolism protein LicD